MATATGWSFAHIGELSLDDLAALWLYWQDHPPVHVSVAALLRSWGGKPSGRPAAPSPASDPDPPSTGAMEAVAAVLGPPDRAFRPPCRMQAPAPDPDPTP